MQDLTIIARLLQDVLDAYDKLLAQPEAITRKTPQGVCHMLNNATTDRAAYNTEAKAIEYWHAAKVIGTRVRALLEGCAFYSHWLTCRHNIKPDFDSNAYLVQLCRSRRAWVQWMLDTVRSGQMF